jgi:uncharacterized protein YjiS (DUF1127 family)
MLITIMKLADYSGRGFAGAGRALEMASAELWRWLQRRQAAAELHAMSDYSLKDIGIARSRIDEQLRLAAKSHAPQRRRAGPI